MTGFTKVMPEEPDYPLWQWIIQQRETAAVKSEDIISDEALDNLRAEFGLMHAHQEEQDVVVGEGGREEHGVNAV